MFGTNWPVDILYATYLEQTDAYRPILAEAGFSREEQERDALPRTPSASTGSDPSPPVQDRAPRETHDPSPTKLFAALIGIVLVVGAPVPTRRPRPRRQATRRHPRPRRSEAPATEAPPSAAPAAMKVGYISLGEAIPFVSLVTNSIKDEAAKVPASRSSSATPRSTRRRPSSCAQNLKVQQVQAVLNFQLFEDSSPEVCAAYGDLPTIAIDIHQAPCEVAFMGADNTLAGTIAGQGRGRCPQGRERLHLRRPSSPSTPRAPARRPWPAWTA